MTSWTEILKANKGLYARDSFSELWGLKLKAARAEFPDYTITGTLPLSFNSRVAGALKNYRIYGTSAGSGTPTESGEPAGYKIPISSTDGTSTSNYDLFLGDTKLYEDEYVDFVEQKIYRTILLTTHDNKDFITSDNKRFCVRRSNNG